MIEFPQVPNDRRHFVHKRIGRAVKGFVTSGFSPVGAAVGFVSPADEPRRIPPPRSTTARPSRFSAAEKEAGRGIKFPSASVFARRRRAFGRDAAAGISIPSLAGRCPPLMKRDPVSGECKFFVGDRPGRDTEPLQIGPGVPVGDAVMGRYGAALTPGSKIVDRAVCLRGMQLGNDGLCYNKGQISNKERMWPRGRRPLLTGGDMRAISIAARAASRLTRPAVRLQDIGLIKKPVTRKPRKKS